MGGGYAAWWALALSLVCHCEFRTLPTAAAAVSRALLSDPEAEGRGEAAEVGGDTAHVAVPAPASTRKQKQKQKQKPLPMYNTTETRCVRLRPSFAFVLSRSARSLLRRPTRWSQSSSGLGRPR